MIDFYDFATISSRSLAYLLARRIDIAGVENLPASGPVILAPNHQTMADPPVLAGFLPRRVRYMVKQEAWDSPGIGQISRWYGAFPVRRGEGDIGAYRAALKSLKRNEVLGIFPEGHRSKDGHLLPLRSGAIVLALRTGAPIVPAGMWGIRDVLGGWGFFRRHAVGLRIGEAYHPSPSADGSFTEQTDDLARRIESLLPVEYHRRLIPTSAS